MSRSTQVKRATAGFTLIEVLVALAIVAVSLSAIGQLVATTARGARSMEEHFTRLETAREIATALPGRDQLAIGNVSGEIASHHWRIDISPFLAANVVEEHASPWVPQLVVMTVRSTTGAPIKVSTVRLRKRAGE